MPPPPPPGLTPESIFAAWLARHEASEEPDLEALCQEHPEHSTRLRELHGMWDNLKGVFQLAGLAGSLARSPRSPQGSAVDPEVSGEEEQGAASRDLLSKLLERLAGRGPGSTRYRLEGEVGHGGMGVVLRVWDEDLRRHLAMKVLLGKNAGAASGDAPLVDKRHLARFLEEAQVTGQLDHPGIVPVHELGIDTQGRVYFTMRLVKGRTLGEIFELVGEGKGGWTRTRALGVILRICEAMSYAHSKGVIHRDLKPSNVMLGRFGEVYVMDWGVAKVLGTEDARDLRLKPDETTQVLETDRHDEQELDPDTPLVTMDGMIVGTPAYMSPEQARGEIDALDARTDVYAVGAMLYHLLTSRMPYLPAGQHPGPHAIWRRVLGGPPDPVHELAPDVPAELEAICDKAMARERAQRYADVLELAEDLRAYVEGRVVHAYETGAWAEARKWVRRNKPLAGSLAGALLLALGGAGTLAYVQTERRQAAESVLRLSALQDVEDLIAEAEELWPPHPERVEAYRDWIAEARELVAEAPRHRAKRDELRALALPGSEERGDWQYPEEYAEDRWWHEQLSKLIEDLERLQAGLLAEDTTTADHGWSLPKRLALAENLEAGFAPGGRYTLAWERHLPAIRAAYAGLELGPQMGLVPIGPDPESSLWEFAHLMTGTPAERDADGRLALTEDTGVVLVLLPSAAFWMGAQKDDPAKRNYDPEAAVDEGPVHEVELSAFFLSKYELTQGQWERVTGHNPSQYGPHHNWGPSWLASGAGASLLHPVEQVSWLDCMKWLPRAGLGLPSEAQWECGARGGTDSPWWTGVDEQTLAGATNLGDKYALENGGAHWVGHELWLDDGALVHTAAGTYSANAFGLHDVVGNVWEWCLDGYDDGFYRRTPKVDPTAPWEGAAVRANRGGGFNYAAASARSANRSANTPSDADFILGVRVARAITK